MDTKRKEIVSPNRFCGCSNVLSIESMRLISFSGECK